MQITTIGLDIAKNVFQVHGIDATEKVVVRKQLRRRQVLEFFKALPPCLIGMEACATAHYWARELTKLGHKVRLMPAKDVKAFSNRPFGVKLLQTIHHYSVDVARGLVLLFGFGTKALPSWDQKNEEEQSKSRPCC
jgi:transposase